MWHTRNRINGLITLQASQGAHSSLWPRQLFINNKSQSHDFRSWGMGGKACDYRHELSFRPACANIVRHWSHVFLPFLVAEAESTGSGH